MRGWALQLMMAVGLVAIPGTAMAQHAGGDPPMTEPAHVRSPHPALQALIARADEQSPTFHRLVETINASDGIVYVIEGKCGHGVRACLVTVSKEGPTRFLWVRVATHKADLDFMASIGHELRHTIEVLSEPTVTSGAAMYLFYSGVGSQDPDTAFETTAAVDAGNLVWSEVRKYRARAKAK
jgi:hypothetical protein